MVARIKFDATPSGSKFDHDQTLAVCARRLFALTQSPPTSTLDGDNTPSPAMQVVRL
jgi:hypothetical protein